MDQQIKPPLPIKLESVSLLLDTTFDNGGISMFTDSKNRVWYLTLVTDKAIQQMKEKNLLFPNGGSGMAR